MKETLTKEQAIQEHRKMWNWIAKNCNRKTSLSIRQLKAMYIKKFNTGSLTNNCFCCEYAGPQVTNSAEHMCDYCPILWGSERKKNISCFYCEYKVERADFNGLYSRACRLSNHRHYFMARILARKIANLPSKKEEEI